MRPQPKTRERVVAIRNVVLRCDADGFPHPLGLSGRATGNDLVCG